MKIKYYIRRPIAGIPLNGSEFLTKSGDNEPILFDSKDAAKEYLINAGYGTDALAHDLDNGALVIDIWVDNERSKDVNE